MKRHALTNLNLKPKPKPKPETKIPGTYSKKTLEAFFTPKRRKTADAVIREPAAAGREHMHVGSDGERTKKNMKIKEPEVALSNEQERILRMVVQEEKNIFFTGSAGKSLNHLPHSRLGNRAEG